MNESEQVSLAINIGKRLNNWCVPGDGRDELRGTPLWNQTFEKLIKPPAQLRELFMANFFKVRAFKNQAPVNLIPNPAQRYIARYRTRQNSWLKAGRAGLTTWLGVDALLHVMTHPGATAVLASHDFDSAKEAFTQVQFTFESLSARPIGHEMRKGVWRTGGRGGKQNVREIYFPVLNSGFRVETAGDAAPAQGSSIQRLLADEVARWTKGDPEQTLVGMMSHVTGDDTEINIFSRPKGSSGIFYDNYRGAKEGTNGFASHFIQWWWNPFQAVAVPADFHPNDEEAAVLHNYREWRQRSAPEYCYLPAELSLAQLAWRRGERAKSGDRFDQEFASDDVACFFGSGNCPFDAMAMEKILHDTTKVVAGDEKSEHGLLVWREPQEHHRYVLFADIASTLFTSRDAMEVFDLDTGEQCAEWVGRIDPVGFAVILRENAVRYNMALLAVENNLGKISATIFSTLAGYKNMYWMRDVKQPTLGWTTDGKTRPSMLETLQGELMKNPQNFHSRRLVGEMKNHERKGDRIEPRNDKLTGDIVIAAAGALEIRRLGGWMRKPWAETITPGRTTDLERTFINVTN